MSSVAGLINTLFGSRRISGQRRKSKRSDERRVESLENRLAMAVDVAFQTPTGGTGEDWAVVLVNAGSDAYVKRVSTASQDLFIADNASFFDRDVIQGVDQAIDNLYVFNGQLVNRGTTFVNDGTPFGLPVDYPSGQTTEMRFSFFNAIAFDDRVTGVLNLGDGSPEISFTNIDPITGQVTTDFFITAGNDPGNFSITLNRVFPNNSTFIYADELILRSNSFGVSVGSNAMPTLRLDHRVFGSTTRIERISGLTRAESSQAEDGNVVITEFDLFDSDYHKYVPGTLSGRININFPETQEILAGNPLVFQVQETGRGVVPLSFGNDEFSAYGVRTAEASIISQGNGITISGVFDQDTGRVSLRTSRIADGAPSRPLRLSTTLDNVSMGLYDKDPTDDFTNQITLFDQAANGFTLYDGQNFTRGLIAELPNADSVISIESPLVTAGGVADEVILAANTININTPVRATSQFTVPSATESIFGTVSESVGVFAPVAAPVFDVRLADDPNTGNLDRSKLLIGSAGSFSNLANVLNPVPAVLPNATSTYVEVRDGDIFVEGQIAATQQSYLMMSPSGSETEGPYRFTTQSQSTGVDTGVIAGGTVAVTLANDTFGQNFEAFQTMFSDVSLSTDIDRLRIQAGSREGHSLDFPFPYNLTVNEDDNLIIDAVAASSGDINVSTAGSLDLLAAVNSLGNIDFESGAAFTVSAPISTSFGKIEITGPEVSVNNSVRVLDGLVNHQQSDVIITATNGPLVMNDAILAINGVKLETNGTTGDISGNARVISDWVTVDASADVQLLTDANAVRVRSPGSVTVDDISNAAFDIRESPFVTLVANGQDQLVDADNNPLTGDSKGREALSPALYADVYDADNIVVSAPNGSVDVLHHGARPVELGDGDAIRASAENPLITPPPVVSAAGSVVIRSTLSGDVLVSDAPTATNGAANVRFATTQALPGTVPAPGSFFMSDFKASPQAGVYPTELETTLEMVDAVDPVTGDTQKQVPVIDNVNPNDLKLGDRLLVKNGMEGVAAQNGLGDSDIVNGVYVLRELEFISAAAVKLSLVRATAFDTTQDLDGRRYVRVTDGSLVGETRGKVFVSEGFETVSPGGNSPTPLRVDSVPSQTGYITAAAVTTSALNATYDSGAGLITAIQAGSIQNDSALFDGVVLSEGDRVVVRDPVGGDGAAIGIYEVDSEGGQSEWILRRYQGIDENGDGLIDTVFTGVVAVTQGVLRTTNTGQMFEVSFEAINEAPLRFTEITDFRDMDLNGETYLTADFNPLTQYRTDIGTNNPLGTVTFEVTSEAGRNNATGSLGKTLQLVQDNAALVGRDGGEKLPQEFQTRIGIGVTRIDLEQELPLINLPVTIDGGIAGLTIDGSRIEVSRNGSVVRAGGVFARLGPVKPSTVSTARRLVRNAGEAAGLDEVNGIEIGAGGAGTIVRNVSVGGFETGAAIKIVGAKNVLLDDVFAGIDPQGNAMANKYGVRVENGAAGGNAEFSTLHNSTVVASTEAGISVGLNADGFRVIGSKIGLNGLSNTVGIDVAPGDQNTLHIGTDRILPSLAKPAVSITPINGTTVTVDKTLALDFEEGIQFFNRSTNKTWTVDQISDDVGDEAKYVMTLSGPVFDASEFNVVTVVEAGYFVDAVARSETITLPEGVDRNRLFVGQLVLGTTAGALLPGTFITSIEEGVGINSGSTIIGVSQPLQTTVRTGIVFSAPNRNDISFNVDGVVLKSGSSSIMATDVTRSIYDGIRIEGVDPNGMHQIGGADGINVAADNVAVHSNTLAGIRFTEKFFEGLVFADDRREQADRVDIKGNFLGTNLVFAQGLSNGLDGATNIVFEDADMQAFYVSRTERDPTTGRYLAKYRPEDNPDQDEELVEFESFDSEGNLHFTGDPVSQLPPGGFPGFGGGGGGSGSGPNPSTPPTMR